MARGRARPGEASTPRTDFQVGLCVYCVCVYVRVYSIYVCMLFCMYVIHVYM